MSWFALTVDTYRVVEPPPSQHAYDPREDKSYARHPQSFLRDKIPVQGSLGELSGRRGV